MATAQSPNLNQAKAEQFAEKMLGVLNGGALTLMISVGHRTGLFDAMAGLPASSSADIAGKANLNERYVREWLGALVTGGVVEYNLELGAYQLPPEHAAVLTRDSAPDNMASIAQWVPLLSTVENEIVECFRHGGGVPYSAYDRFHEVMADESGQTVVIALVDHILPLAPGLIDRLKAGIDAADVGCGSGRAINRMAREFPGSRFTGYDFSEEGVAAGRAEAERLGLKNVRFEVQDAAKLAERDAFDVIFAFDAIHDQAAPDEVLRRIAAALRNDGLFLMQDIGVSSHVHKNTQHPIAPLVYTISCMHCMTVSLAQDGAGLGAAWGEELAVQMLSDAGFGSVEVKQLPHDILNNYYLARKA